LGYPKTNKWKTKDMGVLAQEIIKVLPEVVSYKNDKWFVKYDEIVALCIQAIKEQNTKLEEQKNKLKSLEEQAKEKGLI
jgi:cell shape-determining protein MreC